MGSEGEHCWPRWPCRFTIRDIRSPRSVLRTLCRLTTFGVDQGWGSVMASPALGSIDRVIDPVQRGTPMRYDDHCQATQRTPKRGNELAISCLRPDWPPVSASEAVPDDDIRAVVASWKIERRERQNAAVVCPASPRTDRMIDRSRPIVTGSPRLQPATHVHDVPLQDRLLMRYFTLAISCVLAVCLASMGSAPGDAQPPPSRRRRRRPQARG